MSFLTKLLGTSTLKTKGGDIAVDTLAGKNIFLYFSASWCPPCRGFTPVLAEYYKNHKDTKNFEVIFLTWDEEEDEFQEYFEHHPWMALDFNKCQEVMEGINAKYKVESIPTLILLDKDGEMLARDARMKVPSDPTAAGFPYNTK
eukprot:TRINITY_DN3867_c0_g1_i2.p2 TRINITY_DN3867_c0_g1~~TRINITY_DN3867_c0_g1_i2.p2  ORF type:complete len:145 (+),score=59.54 TRINITY_DN3867_c0_g1_i2:180-614(+)